jgi:hypothetical protein
MCCNICMTGETFLGQVKNSDTKLVKWSSASTGLSEVHWTRTTVGGPNNLGGSVTLIIIIMQTIKVYIVFSSLSQYRPSPLSQYQAEALSAVPSSFVGIIFGLYLHVTPAFVLSWRRCFCLEDLRRRRRPPTSMIGELVSFLVFKINNWKMESLWVNLNIWRTYSRSLA